MPEYVYTAKDVRGKTLKSTLEADNLDEFYRALHDRGQFCLTVRLAGRQSMNISISGAKIKLRDLSVFSRQFSTMLSAGLPVNKCLDILYEQTAQKRLKAVILGIYESVQRGESLSRAMRAQKSAFPELMLNMIEAGEVSGSLDIVMSRMADQFEKDAKTQNKVQQAMIYPAVLGVITVAVVVLMLAFVLPSFMGMFNSFGGKIPVTTQVLLGIGNALKEYWYLFLAGILLIVLLVGAFLKNPSGRMTWDTWKLKLPVIGKLLVVLESARFSRTMASLFGSGIPIVQSIDIVSRVVKNARIKDGLYRVNEDVRRGVAISAAVKKLGIFPTMLCSMLSVGEESGNMEEILNKTAGFYDEESDAAITKLVALLEPAMIVILAVVVGFIIISTITPIYSIYSSINANG